MATLPEPSVNGNVVSGKVVLAQHPIGIQDLLVVLYDLDPGTRPEDVIATVDAQNGLNSLGDRIGSVLTEADGSFRLTYEHGDFRVRNEAEKRPDLLLLVMAPEVPGKPVKDLILFKAAETRQDAGRVESYLIQLSAEDLERAGLPITETPSAPGAETGEQELALFESRLKAGKRFFDRKAEILREQVDVDHVQYAAERTTTFSVNVKEELSQVPKSVRKGGPPGSRIPCARAPPSSPRTRPSIPRPSAA